MARKPPDWRQPSLFTADPATSAGSAPPQTAEPEDKSPSKPEGDHHAVQNDHPRTPATTTGVTRPAPKGPETPPDDGTLRQRVEDQPRGVEGNAVGAEAGQRPEPDRERGNGDGHQGTGGSFVQRISTGQDRSTFARRGNGLPPNSYV